MLYDELDRVLSQEQEIAPSSGFLDEVMSAVQREAATPPPIPFPWKRALPGIAAAIFVLTFLVVSSIAIVLRGTPGSSAPTSLPASLLSILHLAQTAGAGWILFALVLSFVSVKLSTRLAVGRA